MRYKLYWADDARQASCSMLMRPIIFFPRGQTESYTRASRRLLNKLYILSANPNSESIPARPLFIFSKKELCPNSPIIRFRNVKCLHDIASYLSYYIRAAPARQNQNFTFPELSWGRGRSNFLYPRRDAIQYCTEPNLTVLTGQAWPCMLGRARALHVYRRSSICELFNFTQITHTLR